MASHYFSLVTRRAGSQEYLPVTQTGRAICRGALGGWGNLEEQHRECLEIHIVTKTEVPRYIPLKVIDEWHNSMMRLGIGTGWHAPDSSTFNQTFVSQDMYSFVQAIKPTRATDRVRHKYGNDCRLYEHGAHINADWQLYRQLFERPYHQAGLWCIVAMEKVIEKRDKINTDYGEGAFGKVFDLLVRVFLLNIAATESISSGHFVSLGGGELPVNIIDRRIIQLHDYLNMSFAERAAHAAGTVAEGSYLIPSTHNLFSNLPGSFGGQRLQHISRASSHNKLRILFDDAGGTVGTDYNITTCEALVRWSIKDTMLLHCTDMILGAIASDAYRYTPSANAAGALAALKQRVGG